MEMVSKTEEKRGKYDRLANTVRGVTLASRGHTYPTQGLPSSMCLWWSTHEGLGLLSLQLLWVRWNVQTRAGPSGSWRNRTGPVATKHVFFVGAGQPCTRIHGTSPTCTSASSESLHHMPTATSSPHYTPQTENAWQRFLKLWQQSWNWACYCQLWWERNLYQLEKPHFGNFCYGKWWNYVSCLWRKCNKPARLWRG